jgi:hypothetical protein
MMDNPPWRRTVKGAMQKYTEGRWVKIDRSEIARLSKTEAQVWLAINNLLCDEQCRTKYRWDEFKKANVSKLSKYMNEVLLDQLPVLQDLRRTLDQLTIMAPPDATSSSLLIASVPEVRDGLVRDLGDVKAAAREFIKRLNSGGEEERQREMMRLAEVYGASNFEEFLDDPKCSSCGKPAEKRCSRCKTEWYCGRECQVGAWKAHKPLCDVLMSATAAAPAAK